ncbi:MAG: HD domain-containing protein [Geovibrio sp.]|nr:HD domain-containing protein [Geovibrio sp.]
MSEKSASPDQILLKPGPLDAEEWRIMKEHARIGYKIIGGHGSELLQTAATAALTHHEKWDGSGYPDGLKGDEIPIVGRIAAVADVFDALGSDRVYKKAWDMDRILKLMQEESGQHFDPALVKVFF